MYRQKDIFDKVFLVGRNMGTVGPGVWERSDVSRARQEAGLPEPGVCMPVATSSTPPDTFTPVLLEQSTDDLLPWEPSGGRGGERRNILSFLDAVQGSEWSDRGEDTFAQEDAVPVGVTGPRRRDNT